jgi:hypothetical protein
MLLRNIPFYDGKKLLLENNIYQYYVHECQMWDLLPNFESLHIYFLSICSINLFENENNNNYWIRC